MDKYSCKYCEYFTKRKNDYNRHISTKKHLDKVKSYSACPICNFHVNDLTFHISECFKKYEILKKYETDKLKDDIIKLKMIIYDIDTNNVEIKLSNPIFLNKLKLCVTIYDQYKKKSINNYILSLVEYEVNNYRECSITNIPVKDLIQKVFTKLDEIFHSKNQKNIEELDFQINDLYQEHLFFVDQINDNYLNKVISFENKERKIAKLNREYDNKILEIYQDYFYHIIKEILNNNEFHDHIYLKCMINKN